MGELKADGLLRGVKQRIAVMLGFKGFRNAAITIAGIELMHRIRKGQFDRHVWAFKASLRRQSGTRCLGRDACPAQRGAFAHAGHLRKSRLKDRSAS
jgi:transposase-like protein